MHDVIRDMALWIACDYEKEKENFLVYAGVGLTKVPDIRDWEKAHTCPHLLTFFLDDNEFRKIPGDFFQFMPSLTVLNLSCIKLKSVPLGTSRLVPLQQLDHSYSSIKELQEELNALIKVKCLNIDHHFIWWGGSLSRGVARFGIFGGIELHLRSVRALQFILSSHKLRSCTQALFLQSFNDSTWLDISLLAELKEDLKMEYTGGAKNKRQPSIIGVGEFAEALEVVENLNPFAKLQYLGLENLPNVESIYCKPLPFPCLKRNDCG
ncbi:putative disease resistance protein [Citrus sinensis]|uniref:Disease resistance protein n=1 Tax=Citrus sinensis TaxID=2711 RepID=A0ACB8JBG3_CITSI|nr:putative disease resistance protein [Citrus sinensis]